MHVPHKLTFQILVIVLAAVVVAAGGWYYFGVSRIIHWSMVDVSQRRSGDAHLLEFPNGHVILIDTGTDHHTRHELIPYMERRGIDRIHQLIITHAHENHYGGIKSLLRYIDRVDRIYFNLPPEERCKKEDWVTGCDYDAMIRTREMIEQSSTMLLDLKPGELLYRDPERNITLEVVYVHDGLSEPIGQTDINDTSAFLRLTYGDTTVLFTGDLNKDVASYLVEQNYVLKAPIMTAPHHGVEGAAGDDFLERVDPEVVMVSNNADSWFSDRGERMRKFVEANDVTAYVSGIHGDVVTRISPDGYTVSTEQRSDVSGVAEPADGAD